MRISDWSSDVCSSDLLALVELTLPALNGFLDAQIAVRYVAADGLILPVIALTLIVGIAGGLYPALVLSRLEPARVLKANRPAAGAEGSGRVGGMLTVAPFAVLSGTCGVATECVRRV